MAWVVRKPFEVFLLFLRNIDVNAVKKIMVCIKELKNLVEGNFNRRGKEYPIWEVGRHLDICYKQSQDESMYSCVAWPKRARRDLKIQKWSQSKFKKTMHEKQKQKIWLHLNPLTHSSGQGWLGECLKLGEVYSWASLPHSVQTSQTSVAQLYCLTVKMHFKWVCCK